MIDSQNANDREHLKKKSPNENIWLFKALTLKLKASMYFETPCIVPGCV